MHPIHYILIYLAVACIVSLSFHYGFNKNYPKDDNLEIAFSCGMLWFITIPYFLYKGIRGTYGSSKSKIK